MRPTRLVLVKNFPIVFVIDLVARECAELVARPEKRDRDNKGAGKLEGVALCEIEICVNRRAPS